MRLIIFGLLIWIIGCIQVCPTCLNKNNTKFYSSLTASTALDRISKRNFPLNHIYQHYNTGKGVSVYVFDGGILSTHPELIGRVRKGYVAYPNDPELCNAHGSAVAGAIAGTELGVAPEVSLVDVKIFSCSMQRASINNIINGARWVIQDHINHPGPALVNWSFSADSGMGIFLLDGIVKMLIMNNISVVVSAGNMNKDACWISPANIPGVIAVGSEEMIKDSLGNLQDERDPDTAWGNCITIFAPGSKILLPDIHVEHDSLSGENSLLPTINEWWGTSFAAAYTSGAVALYLESHPNASPQEVTEYIINSSIPDIVKNGRGFNRLLYIGP